MQHNVSQNRPAFFHAILLPQTIKGVHMPFVACNYIQTTHWAICCLQLLHAMKLPSVSTPLRYVMTETL